MEQATPLHAMSHHPVAYQQFIVIGALALLMVKALEPKQKTF